MALPTICCTVIRMLQLLPPSRSSLVLIYTRQTKSSFRPWQHCTELEMDRKYIVTKRYDRRKFRDTPDLNPVRNGWLPKLKQAEGRHESGCVLLVTDLGTNWGPRITTGTSFRHPTLLRIVGNQLRCNVQDLLKLLKRPLPWLKRRTW